MNEKPRDIRDSHHDASGDMGVSSEREGRRAPARRAPTASATSRPLSATPTPTGDDVPPEQRPGAVETNPEGIPPKAGYSSRDPRSGS